MIKDDELAKFWANLSKNGAVKHDMVNWKKIEVKEVEQSES